MNERPWQSNLWRSIHETPHVAPHTSVAAYLMFEDGHVIRGALFQGSHKDCTGTFAGTKDLQVLPGVVKWQPVLGKTAAMAPTPKSPVNVDPPKEDELPIEEQIFNDLLKPHGWTSMEYAPQGNVTSWILTTHGNIEEAKCYLDEKNRPYWGPDEGCRLKAVAWKQRVHGGAKPERPERKTGQWPDEVKERVASAPIVYEDLDIVSANSCWYPPYSLVGRSGELSQEWALTADGEIYLGKYQGDKLGWRDEREQELPNVIAYSPAVREGLFKTGGKPKRPPLQAGHWPDEPVPEWMEHPVLIELGTGQLKLPYDAWLPRSALPQDLHPQLGRWALLMHGEVQRLYARHSPSYGWTEWVDLNDKVVDYVVAWAVCKGVTPPRLPLLYSGDWPTKEQVTSERERAMAQTPPDESYSNLKGPGAEKPDRLQWLADFLHDIVPGLSAAFSKKDDKEPEGLFSSPLTIPQFTHDVPLRPKAEAEPVEKSPVDDRDWTDGMYKTVDDYKIPPILESKCESTRELHEGVVRGILRDLISKETRDLTLTEYWDQMTPTEAYIMRGLLLGQEHFVDRQNPAATDYNRLYQSGFTTKVMVNFGPRLSRPYSFYGGSGAGGKGEIVTGGGGGSGYHQHLWVLTDLGRQFMSYLVAREHRAAVAKIPRL